MNAYAEIRLRNSVLRDVTDPVLTGLPLRDGQYFEVEMHDVEDGEDDSIVTLNLGKYADLNASQEQFLNANDAVREYAVKDNLAETHARSCPNCGSHNIQMTDVSERLTQMQADNDPLAAIRVEVNALALY